MNWLRNRLTTFFIFVGVILLCLSDFPLVPGALLLIAATTLLMTASDAGYNSLVSSAQRMSCPSQLSIEELHEALQSASFGPWGTVRMAGIRMIRGPVLLLESPKMPEYFYIYKGHFGRKLYVATSTIKSHIRDLPADWKTDAIVTAPKISHAAPENLSAPQVMRMLTCACRSYTEEGTICFLPTEKMMQEEDDTPPAPIAAYLSWRERLRSSKYYGLFLSGLGLVIGLLWLCGLSVSFASEEAEGIYSAIMLFVVLPSAVILFLWGIVRQIKDRLHT